MSQKIGPKEAMIRAMREQKSAKNCLQKPANPNDKKKRINAALKAVKRISTKTKVH